MERSHIDLIRWEVRKRGLNFTYVEDEAVDYLCCQVQELTDEGFSFDEAFHAALAKATEEGMFSLKTTLTNSTTSNVMDMLKSYLNIALRNFTKHRMNSTVNVFGLVLALYSVLVIGMYVTNEFKYDTSFPDSERLFRVNGTSYMEDVPISSNYVSPLLMDAMLEEIPEVEFAASGLSMGTAKPMVIADKNYYDIRIDYFKKDVFEIFGIEILEGDLNAAYEQPYAVLVSKSFANRMFGNRSPLNETIKAEIYGKDITFTILGVYKDLPKKSHLSYGWNKMEVIGSQKAWELIGGSKGQWGSTHMPAYVKISENGDPKEIETKINDLLVRRAGENIFYRHYLQPVWDIHLNTLGLPTSSQGNLTNVVTFGLIGLLILLIACINYINMATARVTIRMKEVGVRKVLGAVKGQLLFQFIVEAFILTSISLLISLALMAVSLDYLNTTFNLNLSLSLFENGELFFGLFMVLFTISAIAGGYPGLYMSKLSSTNLLKSVVKLGSSKFSLRKVLVVFQFGISAAIIVCTIVVLNQLHFMRKSDLGYDKTSIVYINLPYAEIKTKGQLFKDALTKIPIVKSVALTAGSLAKGDFSGNRITIGNNEPGSMQKIIPVDFEYMSTMGFELIEGRWFDPDMANDIENGFVVNEAFLKYFDLQSPIGQKISRNEQKGEIIGVAKDFHWKSMHSEIEPLVMFMEKDYAQRYGNIVVKLKHGDLLYSKEQFKEAWVSIFGDRPFEWQFLDAQIEQVYRSDKIFGDIFSSFSAIAIAISCLGLMGLVSFSVERRLKEIGIRKVLGATVSNILLMISKDFSRLILIGFTLSIPVAYFFIAQWLENFKYRIELDYWPFLLACLVTIVIACLTVSFIALKGARSNPVDSLRSE